MIQACVAIKIVPVEVSQYTYGVYKLPTGEIVNTLLSESGPMRYIPYEHAIQRTLSLGKFIVRKSGDKKESHVLMYEDTCNNIVRSVIPKSGWSGYEEEIKSVFNIGTNLYVIVDMKVHIDDKKKKRYIRIYEVTDGVPRALRQNLAPKKSKGIYIENV